MKKKSSRPLLDKKEAELSRSFKRDIWRTETKLSEYDKFSKAARAAKSERTNIRLSESDLSQIKERAQEFGIGYQTLIASLVHQYVSGNLVELSVVRRLFIRNLKRR